MREIKVYSKEEIIKILGITEAQFRHAKEQLRFTEVSKDKNYLYYTDETVELIRKHRREIGKPCKGLTADMFDDVKQAPSNEDIMMAIKRLDSQISILTICVNNYIQQNQQNEKKPDNCLGEFQ